MQITDQSAKERADLAELAAKRILQAMKARGWNQSDLGRETGIAAHKINRVLQASGLSSVEVYMRIAGRLEVTVDSLFATPDNTPKKAAPKKAAAPAKKKAAKKKISKPTKRAAHYRR